MSVVKTEETANKVETKVAEDEDKEDDDKETKAEAVETATVDNVSLPVAKIMSEDQEITPDTVEKSHLEEVNSSMFNYSLRRNLRFPRRRTSPTKNANLARPKAKPYSV